MKKIKLDRNILSNLIYYKYNVKRDGRIMNTKRFTSITINLVCGLAWVLPVYFFARDFFHIDKIRELSQQNILDVLFFSVKQSFYSTVVAFLIALIPAYYSAYKRNFLTKLINGLIFIPFFFPVISVVTIFSIVFNMEIFKELNILYSLKAIVIANVFYNSPIFVKYIGEGLKRIPKEIIEAMKGDGADNITIFFRGQLPLIMPQTFRGFILVFTYCFLGLGIVLSLGGIKYSIIEVEIANTLMSGANFSKAMYLGIIQVIVLIILNLFGIFIKEYELTGNPETKRLNPVLGVYSFIYAILQYAVVAFSFLYSFVNVITGKFTIKAYENLFSPDFIEDYAVVESLFNSLKISIVVSAISVVLIYIIIKNYNRFTDILIFSNLGISGAFLAITLYYLNVLFDIPLAFLLILGYLIVVIPIGYSFMYQYVKKFPREVLESGDLDCKNSLQRFIYVEFPILKNIFLSAFLQIFAIVFGEFTIGYTMQLEDIFPVASLVNYSLVSNKQYMESSAFTSIIIAIILSAFILGEYLKSED